MSNFNGMTDDNCRRAILVHKYKDSIIRMNAKEEEKTTNKKLNDELSAELVQLEEQVFQQKFVIKDKPTLPPPDCIAQLFKPCNLDTSKIHFEYFMKLSNLMKEIEMRLTSDYKLNHENRIEPLIVESETLQNSIAKLYNLKNEQIQAYGQIKTDQNAIDRQIEKEILNYNLVTEQNRLIFEEWNQKVEHTKFEVESKENELILLKNYLKSQIDAVTSIEVEQETRQADFV